MLNSDSEEQAPAILPLEGNSATVFCLIQHYGANPGWKHAINRNKIVLLNTYWGALLTTGHTGANLGEGFCIFFCAEEEASRRFAMSARGGPSSLTEGIVLILCNSYSFFF